MVYHLFKNKLFSLFQLMIAWRGYSRCVKLLCELPKQKAHKILLDLKAQKALQETKGALHSALLATRNFGGFSALHLAAQNGHNQSCREILLVGADPDVQNNVSFKLNMLR